LADSFGYKAGLVDFVKGGVDAHRIAIAGVGPQILTQAAGVVGDQGVSRLKDDAGGAVVLFKANGLRAGKPLFSTAPTLSPACSRKP
jgi:hypothetical protein